MTKLIKSAGLSHDEWLKERMKGIGGSDVAAALGISPSRTPVGLWQEKRGQGKPQEPSEPMLWGTILEDPIAKEFQRRTGMKVQKFGYTFVDGEEDWMRANIDRAVINPAIAQTVHVEKYPEKVNRWFSTDTILECKTATAWKAHEWGESQEDEIRAGKVVTDHRIPDYYETQVQWYLRLTGAAVCYVAVLIDNHDLRIYKVERSNIAIEVIVEKCREFWFDYVKAGKAPEAINIDDIRRLYRRESGEMVEADNAAAIAVGEYRNLKAEVQQKEQELKAVATRIAGFIGENTGITIGGEKAATFKAQTRTVFNSAQLKKDDPELWARYAGQSDPVRILRVS
jgi:putative phage-type endonuclease